MQQPFNRNRAVQFWPCQFTLTNATTLQQKETGAIPCQLKILLLTNATTLQQKQSNAIPCQLKILLLTNATTLQHKQSSAIPCQLESFY